MRDFLKLAKQKLKASRPKSQSPTSVAVAQINDPVQAQSESVQPLSTPEPQAAVVSDEATRSHLPDIPETSSEPNPLLEEARKRYKESTESLDQVYELYVTKKPNARLKAKDSEAIVQLLLETGGDKVPMLPLGRVATAVSKLMPLMKLALGLTQNVADVGGFGIVRQRACGLVAVLAAVEDELGRKSEVAAKLDVIIYQASRTKELRKHPTEAVSDLLQVKSLDLVTAMNEYLAWSLKHFLRGFFYNLVGNVVTAGESYRKSVNNLDSAITAFDQALFTQIADVVLRLASKPRDIPDKLADSFYKWLSPSYWEVEEVRWRYDRDRIPETIRWITTLPEFEAWRTGDNQPPHYNSLWLKGHQGVGKSMLAAFIIEVLERSYPDSAVLYFFCRNGESRLRDVRDIVTTLAYQLWRKFPERYDVKSLSDGFLPEKIKSPVLLAEHLLTKQWPTVPELFLVLDGIDECQDSPGDINSQTGEDISGLLSFLIGLPNLRLLVTSRPNQAIATVLESYPVKEIGFDNNKDDVDRYISHQVQRSSFLSKGFSLVDINPVTYLGPLARGNFMLARVVLSEARKATTISEFRNVVETPVPQELNQLYRKAIQRLQLAGRGKFAKEVLMWTLGSGRPLTVQELQEAVELALGDTYIDFEELVQNTLSSFVEIAPPRSGTSTFTVRIIHDSLREFLSRPRLCDFFLDLSYVQSHLAQICMQHLSKPLQRNGKFTHYAALNWMEHLNRAPEEGVVTPDLFETFYKFFHGDGIRQWLTEEVLRDEFDRFYDYDVHGVVIGLRSWMGRALSSTPNPLSSAFRKLPEPMHHNVFEWMTQITEVGTQEIHKSIGAILARLWVHENFEDSERIIRAFKMAWKCLHLSTQNFSDEVDDTWKVSKKGGPRLSWRQPESPYEIMEMSAEFGYDQTNATCVLNVAVVLEKYKFGSNLHAAARLYRWELVRLMVERGADVTATDNGQTVLHLAASAGNLEVMKWVIDHGAAESVYSVLFTAVAEGQLEVVKWLVQERGAKVTATRWGITVLLMAARAGQLEVVKWLVKRGHADVTAKDLEGRTVLLAASDSDHWDVVKWLVANCEGVAANDIQTALHTAAVRGQFGVVRFPVEHGADISARFEDGWTILHIAAAMGNVEVVKWLIKKNVDVTAVNRNGETALQIANEHQIGWNVGNFREIVKLLGG